MSADIRAEFRLLHEWQDWVRDHGFIVDPGYIENMVREIENSGLTDPFSGRSYPGSEVTIASKDCREAIRTGTLISRHRAMLTELKSLP